MPHPPAYTGGQDDDQTRSVDIVHIEPSIREGVHLGTSIYGPEASFPIYQYPPLNTSDPYLTGPPEIPGTLVCNVGQWTGSPYPQFAYQWMADGIDIPGATESTYDTTAPDDGTTITCEVRGYNLKGEDYALTSNSILVNLIEPMEIHDLDYHAITGLHTDTFQTTFAAGNMVLTGMGADTYQTVVRNVAYMMTGKSADDRYDAMSLRLHGITGISIEDTLMVQNDDAVYVINYEGVDALTTGILTPMNLINGNAEYGDMAWTISGAITITTALKKDGSYSWWGGADVDAGQGNVPYSYMTQEVPIETPWITDVDAGNCTMSCDWYQGSSAGLDRANIQFEFLAGDKTTVLSTSSGPGLWASPSSIMFYRLWEVAIPSGTRYIRLIPEFSLLSGEDLNAYIDQIRLFIYKGTKITSRDFGPTFEKWRVRFTLANSYSGCGLSELELRDAIGGNDYCTGGTPIKGSEGLGGLASYAFDDLRNTGYWAGKLNAVAEDLAWIGYDKGSLIKPKEIDITARLGGESLQVGREFFLEGSDDLVNWHVVQYYPYSAVGDFTSGQQKQFVVNDGAFTGFKDYFTGAGYTYYNHVVASKGNVFQAHCRFDMTHFVYYLEDQSATFNYRLRLARINLQKKLGSNYQPGMIYEILEDIPLVSPGLNQGLIWLEQACTSTHKFEYGDMFLILFTDDDAATNPVTAGNGRTRHIDTYGTEKSHYDIRNGMAGLLYPWYTSSTGNFSIGSTNPTTIFNTNTRISTIDFKGNFF